MVLEYRVRLPSEAIHSGVQKMNTVVSKQWIPKKILNDKGYEYTEYGEGSYLIPGTLTTVSLLIRGISVSIADTLTTGTSTKFAFICIRVD